jgi:hypothetical protein
MGLAMSKSEAKRLRMQKTPKPPIVDADTLVVDNSILSATAKCSTYSYVRYALGLNVRGEALPLEAGQAIHIGMESWLGGASIKDAVKAMARHYEGAVDGYLRSLEQDNLTSKDARFEPARVIAIFHAHLQKLEDRFPFKVLKSGLEEPISAIFPEVDGVEREVRYVARRDALVRKWEEGGKWSMDHKTTKRITDWWQDKQKVSSQWSGQVWIGRQLGEDEIEGVIIHAIELPEPHTSDRNCREHNVPFTECSIRHATYDYVYVTRSPAEMEGWELSATKLIQKYAWLTRKAERLGIEGVSEVPMEGRFNEGCVFCSMKEWCRLGRNTNPRVVSATFRLEPWNPLAGKEEVIG